MTKAAKELSEISFNCSDDDQFVLAPRAALYVAFLDVGYSGDDATVLADYALAHPERLLEDCKPSIARAWAAAA